MKNKLHYLFLFLFVCAGVSLTYGQYNFIRVTSFCKHNTDIYIGTTNGIFKSTDEGENWSGSGLSSMNIQGLSVSTKNELWAATNSDYGLFRSTDAGTTWINSSPPLALGFNDIQFDSSGGILAASDYDYLYRSSDNGISWLRLGYTQIGNRLHKIKTAANGDIYVVGDYHLYRTGNLGVTWSILLQKFLGADFEFESDSVMFYGAESANGGIYRSSDMGITWAQRDSGIVQKTVHALLSVEKDILIAGTTPNGIYKSENGGVSWLKTNSNVKIVLALFRVNDTTFLAGGDSGVFKSTDRGNNWFRRPGMLVQADEEYTGSGRFINWLYQNNPNPFTISTQITYQLLEQCEVTLTIYDILGREVATLVNETKPAGSHTVNFNASNLPSGVYLYGLKAGPPAGSGAVKLAKKMTFIK